MERAEKAMKAALPDASYLFKKIPTWKLTVRDWNAEEFKTQTGLLFDQLNQHYDWLHEKVDFQLDEAYIAYKGDKKEKMREKISEVMTLENKIKLVEAVGPIVELVQENAKTLRKEKKCPEQLVAPVSTVVYVADVLSIPAFQRFKNQLFYRYGEKFIEKVCEKKKDVDPKVLELLEYKPDSKAVKERAKEYSEKCKQRKKDDDAKKEAKAAEKEQQKSKKSKDSDDDDEDSDEKPKKKSKKSKKADSDDDEDSEEEKPKKKSKKSKKDESDDEDSEEEKPKKKEKKEEKKPKKEDSDDDSEVEKPKKKVEEPKKEEPKKEEPKKAESDDSDSD